jgi:tetrahydromethanopterin S-methyltransferase subunit D
MKRIAPVIGAALMLIGAVLVLQSVGVLPGSVFHTKATGLGWGAWALAFGAGFLVWARNARAKT